MSDNKMDSLQYRILQYDKPLERMHYDVDFTTNTLICKADNVLINFKGMSNWNIIAKQEFCTFITDDGCTFETSARCSFHTGDCCVFSTGDGCMFKTGDNCDFNTGGWCIFDTSYRCTFNTGTHSSFHTGSSCIFKTDNSCTFRTEDGCIFDTQRNCTFLVGDIVSCTFKNCDGVSTVVDFNNNKSYLLNENFKTMMKLEKNT
jgi:hypothetical protein